VGNCLDIVKAKMVAIIFLLAWRKKVKVVDFKRLQNKKKMILRIWEGVDSAILM
jgi:hypothetical protein